MVGEYGVPGATIPRVAAAAGVAQGTLYLYFSNRAEMLMAALNSIFDHWLELVDQPNERNELQRLWRAGLENSETIATEGGLARPWVEFIAAPPNTGLRDAVAGMQRRSHKVLVDIVEEGQKQGTIQKDVDPEQLAWEWLMFVWAETMARLMGLTEFFEEHRSRPVLESIIARAAATTDRARVAMTEEVPEIDKAVSEDGPSRNHGRRNIV